MAEKDRNTEIGGLICAGCLFIGLGVGLLSMTLACFRKG